MITNIKKTLSYIYKNKKTYSLLFILIFMFCIFQKVEAQDARSIENRLMHDKNFRSISEIKSNKRINAIAFNEITFSIGNVTISGTATKFLEFNIYAATNKNGTYLDNAVFRIIYDQELLGSLIFQNNKVVESPKCSTTFDYYLSGVC